MKITLVDKNNEVVHFFSPSNNQKQSLEGIIKFNELYYNYHSEISDANEAVFCESDVLEL